MCRFLSRYLFEKGKLEVIIKLNDYFGKKGGVTI